MTGGRGRRILVLTQPGDAHADEVRRLLASRGADVVLFDPAEFPARAGLTVPYGAGGLEHRVLRTEGRRVGPDDPEEFPGFRDRREGRVITKALGRPWGMRGKEGWARMTGSATARGIGCADSLRPCPLIVQAYVPKRMELRVTVVGDRVFAAEIHSQRSNHARYDWGRHDQGTTPYAVHRLPADAADRCRRLVALLVLLIAVFRGRATRLAQREPAARGAAEGRLIETIGGMDAVGLDPRSLRRRFGVVAQDTVLFTGTVRQNIRPGDPAAPLDRVVGAARLAGIHDDIAAMPMGYDAMLPEGNGLSGGRRQRVAPARAFLSRPRVLLLDEATSSLDTTAEALIEHDLADWPHTRVVIAHRLSTVRDAALVLVLDGGRTVEQGTHEQLLVRGGRHAALVDGQRETRS